MVAALLFERGCWRGEHRWPEGVSCSPSGWLEKGHPHPLLLTSSPAPGTPTWKHPLTAKA